MDMGKKYRVLLCFKYILGCSGQSRTAECMLLWGRWCPKGLCVQSLGLRPQQRH